VDRSEDEDGSIASWAWDFGDGATSSERNPSHSYASSGTYQVLLLVTDDDGAADTRTRSARAEGPPPPSNERPRAEFRVECSGLTCTFADQSEDRDGTIVSWAWSFGDGATSSERNPVHTYATEGRRDVLLTVTDDLGATDTREHRAEPREEDDDD
jgi:PKD repeat protein